MRIRTRVVSAAIISTVALSTVAGTTGTVAAQTVSSDTAAVAESVAKSAEWQSVPPELRVQIASEIDNMNNSTAAEGSEEWGFLAVAAARAIVAGARAAGPAVYNALSSAVRGGYSAFNGWCVRNPFACAIPGGLVGNAVYEALRSIIG